MPQAKVPLFIGASDVCVAPFDPKRNNVIGTSALKLCEYLACERPVVATKVPGTEFIEQEEIGLLANDNPRSMAKAINKILNDGLDYRMGKDGRVYVKNNDAIIVLVDGVGLIHSYKAFVAAIPYRKRAIPIVFKAYTYQQIRDMVYLSENWVVWNFMDLAYDTIQQVFPGRS